MRDDAEEVLPLTELTTHTTTVLDRIRATRKPAIIMQAGNALAVILEAEQYRQIRREIALYRAIVAGEQDVRAGQIVSQDDVEVRLNALMAD